MAFSKTVPITLGGQTRNLKYGFNALVTLEETFGVKINELLTTLAGGLRLSDMRAILWAGLIHEDKALTPEAVGDMIDGVEDIAAIGTAIKAAIEAAFPSAEKPKVRARASKN